LKGFGRAASSSGLLTLSRVDDFLSFRRMITPWFVEVLFMVGVIAALCAGVFLSIRGVAHHQHNQIYVGLAVLLIGPVAIRLYAEFLVVIFRMNETLTDLREIAIWMGERTVALDQDEVEDDDPEDDDPEAQ
jgi:hypothetical protein